jgi:hypothetical protein
MSDFKKMTVESLRELARKTLGPGHARLKTKGELIRALEGTGEGADPTRASGGPPASAARKAVRAAKDAAKDAGKAAGKAADRARSVARAGKAAAEAAAEGAREAVKTARARKTGKVSTAAAAVAGAAAGVAAAARARRSPAEDGDPEGYFVARVRGEEAVREAPHPMGEVAREALRTPPPIHRPLHDEGLGELPWRYGDDAFVALPRDPRSVFLYWDHSDATVAAGFAGLDSPRAQLWVFVRAGDGWDRIRTIDFALESRSYYVHELEPGRTYRAEIHVLDRHGNERRVAQPSNEVSLPPVGPSPIVDDRFIRIPWDVLLGSILGPGHPGTPFSDEARALLARLSDWARFARPTSVGAGGIGGRPSSPSSPFGPYGPGER